MFLVKAILWLSWCGTAAAAVTFAAKDTITLDPVLTALACLVSTLSGATALAYRINILLIEDSLSENPKGLVRPWLFVLANMGGSWLAGALGFIMGRMNTWDVWTTLFGILLLSFAGAKGIEMLAERWLGVVRLPGIEPHRQPFRRPMPMEDDDDRLDRANR